MLLSETFEAYLVATFENIDTVEVTKMVLETDVEKELLNRIRQIKKILENKNR